MVTLVIMCATGAGSWARAARGCYLLGDQLYPVVPCPSVLCTAQIVPQAARGHPAVLGRVGRGGVLSFHNLRVCHTTTCTARTPHVLLQPACRLHEDIPLYWDAWDVEAYHLEKGWEAGLAPAGEIVDLN